MLTADEGRRHEMMVKVMQDALLRGGGEYLKLSLF